MDKNSLQENEKRKIAFAQFGDFKYEKTPQTAPKKEVMKKTKLIYYDKRQFSCKLPIDIFRGYWKKDDGLEFIRTEDDIGNVTIQINYVRGIKLK